MTHNFEMGIDLGFAVLRTMNYIYPGINRHLAHAANLKWTFQELFY